MKDLLEVLEWWLRKGKEWRVIWANWRKDEGQIWLDSSSGGTYSEHQNVLVTVEEAHAG